MAAEVTLTRPLIALTMEGEEREVDESAHTGVDMTEAAAEAETTLGWGAISGEAEASLREDEI